MNSNAAAKVATPALVIQILAGLTIFFALVSIVLNIAGVGMGSMGGGMGGDERFSQLIGGGVGIALNVISLLFNGFIVFGAQKMKNLESYPLALAAVILFMVPCNCCCLINIPVGIWGLVVLLNAEVKAEFR